MCVFIEGRKVLSYMKLKKNVVNSTERKCLSMSLRTVKKVIADEKLKKVEPESLGQNNITQKGYTWV